MRPSIKDIRKKGKVVEVLSCSKDSWYGNNYVEIYVLDGRNYKVYRNDATDPSWWSFKEVKPKQVTKIVWEEV